MDPQRIPWQYWNQRMAMARSMGLNTIFSYVYWNLLEPQPGQHVTDGNNNIYAFVQDAHSAGLKVVLRVGPYICGEHEWGGFPAWLNNVNNMTVRSNNPQFLNYTALYLSWLGQWLDPLMASNGGPIILIQIENEYGFYGDDHSYTSALAQQFVSSFNATFYTNDGSSQSALQAGEIPNILAEIDGTTPQDSFESRKLYLNASSQGPNLDGEYYITWLDHWGFNQTYQSFVNDTTDISSRVAGLNWTIANGDSFSIYMFHGGTNWGFQSGSDYGPATQPVTTSYDYGAPLDESGRPNDIYFAVRDALRQFLNDTPSVPAIDSMIGIPSIAVQPSFFLFDALPSPVFMQSPTNMESLGQWYGFTLYRHTANSSISGVLQPGVAAKDRVLVYVNQQRVGVIDSTYVTPQVVDVTLKPGDVLDLLNENLGRVNFGPDIPYQTKGIFGNVTVGGGTLSGWNIYTLPLDSPMTAPHGVLEPMNITARSGPVFYEGTFDLSKVSDTWLELPGWTKGIIFVNGVNLGRFWTVGPQQSYYLPGCYLQSLGNQIQIFSLEPTGHEGTVQGVVNRTWANNPDPDFP